MARHRDRWAEVVLRTALWMREAPPEADLCWRELAIVAKALADGRDMTEIGLMRDIACARLPCSRTPGGSDGRARPIPYRHERWSRDRFGAAACRGMPMLLQWLESSAPIAQICFYGLCRIGTLLHEDDRRTAGHPYRQAKAEAALRGRKLKDLVEEGLRLVPPNAANAPRHPSLAGLMKHARGCRSKSGVPDLRSKSRASQGPSAAMPAIVDTGPLVAFFDRAERHHRWAPSASRSSMHPCSSASQCSRKRSICWRASRGPRTRCSSSSGMAPLGVSSGGVTSVRYAAAAKIPGHANVPGRCLCGPHGRNP